MHTPFVAPIEVVQKESEGQLPFESQRKEQNAARPSNDTQTRVSQSGLKSSMQVAVLMFPIASTWVAHTSSTSGDCGKSHGVP